MPSAAARQDAVAAMPCPFNALPNDCLPIDGIVQRASDFADLENSATAELKIDAVHVVAQETENSQRRFAFDEFTASWTNFIQEIDFSAHHRCPRRANRRVGLDHDAIDVVAFRDNTFETAVIDYFFAVAAGRHDKRSRTNTALPSKFS